MDKLSTSSQLANQLSRIENLIPKAPKEIGKSKTDAMNGSDQLGSVESFQEVLSSTLETPVATESPKAAALDTLGAKHTIKFSNHAIERMQTRGISYNPESLLRLDEAIKKAAAKGSKDTLVLMDDSALIVSVKNNTVVTVMDKNNLKENVFTNIDSTVVL
jgi:flagellar operon protein